MSAYRLILLLLFFNTWIASRKPTVEVKPYNTFLYVEKRESENEWYSLTLFLGNPESMSSLQNADTWPSNEPQHRRDELNWSRDLQWSRTRNCVIHCVTIVRKHCYICVCFCISSVAQWEALFHHLIILHLFSERIISNQPVKTVGAILHFSNA